MRRTLAALAFTTLAAWTAPSFAAGITFGQEPDPSVLVARAGLDWIWAAPCSSGPGSCGAPTLHHGFRLPTLAEWTAGFVDRPDLVAAFTLPNGAARCGSPWMSATHNHCDMGDLMNGHIYQAIGFCNPAYFNGCEAGTTESFLVRRGAPVPAPEPATLFLVVTGLALTAGATRRRPATASA